jgi:hypothetical protein
MRHDWRSCSIDRMHKKKSDLWSDLSLSVRMKTAQCGDNCMCLSKCMNRQRYRWEFWATIGWDVLRSSSRPISISGTTEVSALMNVHPIWTPPSKWICQNGLWSNWEHFILTESWNLWIAGPYALKITECGDVCQLESLDQLSNCQIQETPCIVKSVSV